MVLVYAKFVYYLHLLVYEPPPNANLTDHEETREVLEIVHLDRKNSPIAAIINTPTEEVPPGSGTPFLISLSGLLAFKIRTNLL